MVGTAGTMTLCKGLTENGPGGTGPSDSNLSGDFLSALVKVAASEMPEHSFRIHAADSRDRASMHLENAGSGNPYDEVRRSAALLWQPSLLETAQDHGAGEIAKLAAVLRT